MGQMGPDGLRGAAPGRKPLPPLFLQAGEVTGMSDPNARSSSPSTVSHTPRPPQRRTDQERTTADKTARSGAIALIVLAVAFAAVVLSAKLGRRDEDDPIAEAAGEGLPILAEFSSPDCPACQLLQPVIAEIRGEYEGALGVVYVRFDTHPTLARRWRVRATPTILLLDPSGKELSRVVGFVPRERLQAELAKAGVVKPDGASGRRP